MIGKSDKQVLFSKTHWSKRNAHLQRRPFKYIYFLLLFVLCTLFALYFLWIGFRFMNMNPVKIHLTGSENDFSSIETVYDEKVHDQLNFSTTTLLEKSPICNDIPNIEKIDCYPDCPVTEQQCINRGCCYKPVLTKNEKISFNNSCHPPLNIPYCYFPSDYTGYEVISIVNITKGLEATLKRKLASGFPKDIQNLKLTAINIDDNVLRIQIVDAESYRYEPPVARNVIPKSAINPNYRVEISQSYGILSISRISTGIPLFMVNLQQMVYSDQFLSLSSRLSTSNIYGLGEHYDSSFLRDTNWTRTVSFNKDGFPAKDMNLYGTHPFFVGIENYGYSHGVFLLNSNAMEVILQPLPAITYRTIGGIFDFFIFLGPSPSNVVEQYTSIVGRSAMPPYWSLGFHLCRYGYDSLNKTIAVWNRTRNAGIPFDTQWNDIDYMDRQNDFTYDKEKYAGLPEFVDELHKLNMHYVIILDPGVSNTEPKGTYPPYDDGLKANIFVKNSTGDIFIGKVWNPKTTVYPDFSHPGAYEYWLKQIKNFHDIVKFDGLWIDMNEPSNFYNGMKDGCPDNPLDNPPYNPLGDTPLKTRTLCMSAKHYNTTHYNEHNLHGYREAIATEKALRNITGKRPFIISRATFSGQGAYSGHWSGDIASSWEDLMYSNIDLLNFNIFGVPMMGSDICGFRDDTTVELCARWQAVGAFYPFSRNHNDLNAKEQDPVALGDTVVNITKKALTVRYTLLPYLYTLFHKSHVNGTPVISSLPFEFPDDPYTFMCHEQFLWGSGLLIVPCLSEGKESVTQYFPNAKWYDYYTGNFLNVSGTYYNLTVSLQDIPLFVRGGYIIPQQYPALTTVDSRKNNFTIFAALDKNNNATGELFWDDGESLDTFENGQYNLIRFKIHLNQFKSEIVKSGYKTSMDLDEIKICILDLEPTSVTLNGTSIPFKFNNENHCLTIFSKVSLLNNFNVQWK